MAEYIEREAALALVRPDAPEDEKAAVTIATAKKLVRDIVRRTPAADVKKCQTDTTPSQTCMNKGSFCLLLLPKIIRMHGKASGMRTAAFLSAGDGSSWVLTPTKDATHTTMS